VIPKRPRAGRSSDLPVDVLGEHVVLHMDFAYRSFDEKLSFPDL
jgi:hypothetical protein